MKRIFIPTKNAEDWKQFLAEPEKQWRTGFSAKTLANSWEAQEGFPPEITALFSTCDDNKFHDMEMLFAVPEYKVELAGKGEPSHNDIFILARDGKGGLVSIAVEGKVSETFGPTIEQWSANASGGKLTRLKFLKEKLNHAADFPSNIRYQLLHRAASAVIEAERFGAKTAIMIVHSFSQINQGFEDYENFLGLYNINAVKRMLQKVTYIDDITLYCSWAVGDKKYLQSDDLEENINKTYEIIKSQYPNMTIDSLNVVRDVIKHRNYWKPEKVKTLLLAESHVFTPAEDNEMVLQYPHYLYDEGLPPNFVRLVYCLGYGEKTLVPGILKNHGTWQYWRIFASCVANNKHFNFDSVEITGCADINRRLHNKLEMLKNLKSKGVWLVDCSILSLMGRVEKRTSKQKRDLLKISWENYIKKLILEVKPGYIIVIGKRVGRIVEEDPFMLDIPYKVLDQPQARLSSDKHRKILETYQDICSRC